MPTRTRSSLIFLCQTFMVTLSLTLAVLSASAAQLNLASVPLYAGGNVPPIVMIDLSKDHALYQKAYNDYSDVNGDGKIDTTYDDSIDYAGYFDSFKCYTYSTTQHAFVPASTIATATPKNHYCPASTAWSGNFLNWSSMTRMDAVRKILYGGYRSTDTSTSTILERTFLPMDAHSWAKYYNGSDLPKLTPYTYGTGQQVEQTAPTFSSSSTFNLASGTPSVTISTSNQFEIGDQMLLVPASAPANTQMIGWVTKVANGTSSTKPSTITVNIDSRSVSGTSKSYSSWTVSNLSRVGLTLCNTTPNDSSAANRYSQSNNAPPEIRAARGNYALWGASERWQCNWASEHSATQGANLSNGNLPALSGLNASAENPPQSTRGVGTDGEAAGKYYARVQVCIAGLIGNDNCRAYNSAQKPIGLLHTYSGISGSMLFGLMTGTYDRNISGGVLRRNAQDFNTEINSTDGTFNTSVKGIVWNINHLRISGYSYNDGTYFDQTDSTKSDNCNFQQTGIALSGGKNAQGQPAQQGNCSTWGNPMAEVFMESLRYFGGASADATFSVAPATRDQALGLTTETWKDPLTTANYCTPLNTLVFNASVSSYDGDQLSGFSSLGTTTTAPSWTDQVGTGEKVDGNSWFAGSNGTVTDNLCSAKVIGKLSQVLGLCPESPSQQGTFNIAGAAYYAHTNRIRPATNVVSIAAPSNDTTSLRVTSYGVQLATNTPRVTVNVGGRM
ncbi:hypothetical protein [Cupriavidus sp. D39]|uniref:hypothetical protein n=1 Tax=Cupriavidus sp. D39 TaxID=2997877 RepID=UPI00226EC0A8|nr:hypothetical protein [Cupriavidus sp. D39]MCY0856154.1 hypothetical protein [Cupriavidus sp. D39]